MRPRRERWETEFAPVTLELALPDCPPIAWKDVEAAMRANVESIRIREINGRSADVLDYEQNRENGMSVIALGGDTLAQIGRASGKERGCPTVKIAGGDDTFTDKKLNM